MSKQKLSELSVALEEALNDSLDNYEVNVDDKSALGNGYLGEIVSYFFINKYCIYSKI